MTAVTSAIPQPHTGGQSSSSLDRIARQPPSQASHAIERCVLVARHDADGYGLTVSGTHPVRVDAVRPRGAAALAGVRVGDRVAKVNGMLVTESNYQEVLGMISGGQTLALTLQSQLRGYAFDSVKSEQIDEDPCGPAAAESVLNYNYAHRASHPVMSTMPRVALSRFVKRDSLQTEFANSLPFDRPNKSFDFSQSVESEQCHDRDANAVTGYSSTLRSVKSSCSSNVFGEPHVVGAYRSRNDGASRAAPSNNAGSAYTVGAHFSSSSNLPHQSRRRGPASVASSVESAAGVEPAVKSWVDSGGLRYVQASSSLSTAAANLASSSAAAVGELMPMCEDSEDDVDRNIEENTGPFSNLIDLRNRPAHLAVFINYLVNNSNPNSLLFYLISDAFQSTSNAKELRRFAYEIFSTFIIPNAPLHLPDVTQQLVQQVDRVLSSAAAAAASSGSGGGAMPSDADALRRLFLPTRTRAIGDINERLAQFRRRRALRGAGETLGVADDVDAQLARADYAAGAKIAEQVLYRLLDALVAQAGGNVALDFDTFEPRKLALIASVATVIKIVLNIRTSHSPWEKLLEKCPTFVTSAKSTMLSKMKPKRSVQLKDHQFTLNPVCLTLHCYQCRNVFWGVNPQAYFCQYCDVVVHKQCTSKLVDHCYPVAAQQQQKRSAISTTSSVVGSGPILSVASSRLNATNSEGVAGGGGGYGGVSASSISLDAARMHAVGIAPDTLSSNLYGGGGGGGYFDASIGGAFSAGELSARRQNATSCTPPLNRSHASTATIVGSTLAGAGLSGGSRSYLNYATNDEAEEETEADSDLVSALDAGGGGRIAPGRSPATVYTATASSSPASSLKSVLPPPAFSQRFERIVAPPQPPSAEFAPTTSCMSIAAAAIATTTAAVTASAASAATHGDNATAAAAAAAAAAENAAKSMSSDSGIGNELLVIGADGRAISRAQSMKMEASANQSVQIRRNGRGANSLGAADSPTAATAAVPSPLARTNFALMPSAGVHASASFVASSSGAETTGKSVQCPAGLVVAPKCITVLPTLHHTLEMGPSQHATAGSQPASLSASTSTLRAATPLLASAAPSSAGAVVLVENASRASQTDRQLVERVERTVIADSDSDLEMETEVPSLDSILSWEVLRLLKPKEKKRQEVVNEFFHTERTHLRNLKILYKFFYRPMVLQRVESVELIQLLFGNLDELLSVHSEMCAKMRAALATWRAQFAAGTLKLASGALFAGASSGDAASEAGSAPSSSAQSAATAAGAASATGAPPPYGNIGELVESIFDRESGERLMAATALFCQNQQHALDTLRQRYNRATKDDAFSAFLADAESHPLCRKLQLKDMIPVEMQRLVKYPLLLETIAKYTPESSDEFTRLQRGVACAKRILSAVNTAKRNAENRRRLEEIQRRVDYSASDKFAALFQKFDFRNHRLIYEGSLLWRQARGKAVDLHVVLLDHLLVFMTRSGGDGTPAGGPNMRLQLRVAEAGCLPIMRLAYVDVEEKPGDKRAFNLLYKCDLRLFELVAPTATERKTWHRLIENQVVVSSQELPSIGNELSDVFFTPSSMISLATDSSAAEGAAADGAELGNAVAMVRSAIVGPTTAAGAGGASSDSARAVARVEQVHVLTHPNLVTANQIVVEQPRILEHAQVEQAPPAAALSPVERLRRYDRAIVNALVEKHAILAQMLAETKAESGAEELEKLAEELAGLAVAELKHRSTRELAVSAIVFGNRLLDAINSGMTTGSSAREIRERAALPSVPCYKLTAVAAPLMNHIKALVQIAQEQDQQLRSVTAAAAASTQRQISNSDSNSVDKTPPKTAISSDAPQPPATTPVVPPHRNNHLGIATALIGDDSAPPPLPPSSAPPPLD